MLVLPSSFLSTLLLSLYFNILFFALSAAQEDLTYPRHVHLSYGLDEYQMVVTWTTFDTTNISAVEYGLNGFQYQAKGTETLFIDSGSEKRKYYIHRAVMVDLKPGAEYYYHCGSDMGWSDLYFFVNRRVDPSWSPWIAAYGDMGNVNGRSLSRLQQEVARRTIDMVLHVGDFAYDFPDDNGRVGDSFMDQIQSISAYVPYMTCVGNHEYLNNFAHYKNRFSMPGGDNQSMFYSFNVGQAHIIGFSTEAYYYLEFGTDQMLTQFNWLAQDLREANKPETRARYPWIITMGHRPMYCAINDGDDCNYFTDKVRIGLEQLFYDNGVDVELWAHEHSYERMWPVYDGKTCNGSYAEPYTNPQAPVHIVTGSGGCKEEHDPFTEDKPEWCAVRVLDYGYTRIHVLNATHLYLEQVSDDQGGVIVDKVTIIQEHHGPHQYNCANN